MCICHRICRHFLQYFQKKHLSNIFLFKEKNSSSASLERDNLTNYHLLHQKALNPQEAQSLTESPFYEKNINTIRIVFIICTLFIAYNLQAQENHIQFSVVNDTAHVDNNIPVDSLGNMLGIEEDSDLFDNVDHGDGMLFSYFNWMPGYGLYQNFNIISIHYKHVGSAPVTH